MGQANRYVEVFEKGSFEKLPKTVDYSGRVPEGATLASVAVSATNLYSGAEDNSVLSSTTATLDDTNLTASVFVQDGTDGCRYVVSFRATLDDGSKFRDDLLMVVTDNQVGG